MKNALPLVIGTLLAAFTSANAQTTKEEQQALTPDAVVSDLMAGNARYVAEKTTPPNRSARAVTAVSGQHPKAVILSCIDSRVPVELIFDQGIGDIFVGRVAGNVENVDQLGSMEFATKLAGVKLVLVLGHSQCGAVKGACDGAELGNLTALLEKIKPAIKAVEGFESEGRNSSNKPFVDKVIEQNVRQTVADIRKDSPVMAALEKAGTIKIIGAVYALESGKVTLLD